MFGGAVIVAAVLFTYYNMTNATAQWITLPSLLIGLLFIGIYLVADQRIKERRKVVSIFRKLEFGIQE
jgi:UDP-N-acetylmuramyl pentapeptide phosphotransferase/UDP-N-acetylglucosamine-1-phosphate transferase